MADEHAGADLVLKLVLSLAVVLVQDPILAVVPVGIRDLVQVLVQVLVQGCLLEVSSWSGPSPIPSGMAPTSAHSECSSLTSSGPVAVRQNLWVPGQVEPPPHLHCRSHYLYGEVGDLSLCCQVRADVLLLSWTGCGTNS